MGKAGRMRRIALVTAAALLAAGCTVFDGGSESAPPAPASTGHGSVPTGVQPLRKALPALERFVERERGLRFKHPVKVRLLGRKAFLRKLHQGQGKPKPSDVEQLTATLTAIGL